MSVSNEDGKSVGNKWTHPSFVKLQVEKAKKENEEKFKHRPQGQERRTENMQTDHGTLLTYVEMMSSLISPLPNRHSHKPIPRDRTNPKNYGLHPLIYAENVVVPDERDITSAGFFSLACGKDTSNEHQLHKSVTTTEPIANASDRSSSRFAREPFNDTQQSITRHGLVKSVAIEAAFKKRGKVPYSGDSVNLDIHSSLPIPADYTITEEILREVASNTVDEKQYASSNLGISEQSMNKDKWRGDPICYMSYLMTLLNSMTKKTAHDVMKKMVNVCSKAIENIGVILREPFMKCQGLDRNPVEQSNKSNAIGSFATNRCIGYFVALRSILLLHLGEISLALHYLYQIVLHPGQYVLLDFVEQVNACVLMVAILTGLVGPSTFTLSAFSCDFLTIAFPSRLSLSPRLKRAVISILSKAQKMVDDVNHCVSSLTFQRARCNLRNISARINLVNQVDAPRQIVFYHAHMAPMSDIEFIILSQEVGVQFPLEIKALSPFKQYVMLISHLGRNEISAAQEIAATFTSAYEKSVNKKNESASGVTSSILQGKNEGAMGVHDVAAVLIVAIHEGLVGRNENAKKLLNVLLFTRSITSKAMRLIVLKERIAFCFLNKNPTAEFTSIIQSYISSIQRAPNSAESGLGDVGFLIQHFLHDQSYVKECTRLFDSVFRWIDSLETIHESEITTLRHNFLQILQTYPECASESVPIALLGGRIAHYLINLHTLPVPRMKGE